MTPSTYPHLAYDSRTEMRAQIAAGNITQNSKRNAPMHAQSLNGAIPLPELSRALLMVEGRNTVFRDGVLNEAVGLIRQSLFALQAAAMPAAAVANDAVRADA